MSESQYPIVNNYFFFKEMNTDAIGVNYRAGEIDTEARKANNHSLVTEVYPLLSGNPNVWKRINILLEGVKKSNIPKLYSPGKILHEDDRTLLVYPLFKGKTFEEVLDESFKVDNPINFDLAFSIAFAIADLIDVGSSIVVSGEKSFHGFLTPDNILIDYDGKIFLKNYGIYPYLSREEDIFNEMVTKYGAWIAPEFLKKEKLVCQTDIYHLGYILYKILTGKYFSYSAGEDFDSKFSNISFNQHIPSSDKEFLTSIITFFKKSLHPEPSQRFANIKVFKDYISNNFHIEELSSVTFNLAYFMNSLYLESMEVENKELEKELAFTLPEEKTEEPEPVAVPVGKDGDTLVKDILTGLDDHEKTASKSKLIVPLLVVIVIAIAVGIFMIMNQQKQAQKAEQQRLQEIELRQKQVLNQKLKALEDNYEKKLKEIQDKAADTEEEKQKQLDEVNRLKEWKKEEDRKARAKQKAEANRLAKIQKLEDDKKLKEAEEEKQRLAKEQEAEAEKEKQRLAAEAEKQRLASAAQETQTQPGNQTQTTPTEGTPKPQQVETVTKPQVQVGQEVSLSQLTKRPRKTKGRRPVFSAAVRERHRGKSWDVRLMLQIDEKGNVAGVRINTKLPPDLDNMVIKLVKKWKYSPPEKDGVKVKVWQPVGLKLTF
ncbi:MAG: protein kinase [bacterium]|nr:protein kinase [bacterium]